MKTVLYNTIDGYEIITGFGEPVADPVETQSAAAPLVEKTPEYAESLTLKGKLDAAKDKMRKAIADGKKAQKDKKPSALSKAKGEYDDAVAELQALQEDAKELAPRLKAAVRKVREENPVYCEPKAGEKIIDKAEAETLQAAFDARPKDAFVTTSGEVVEDHRGIYWANGPNGWAQEVVSKLGVVPKGKSVDALTAEERQEIEYVLQAERVSKLTRAQKAEELPVMIERAASEAAVMRSKLEIQADIDAFGKSQDWYNAEVQRLEALYS